MITDMTPAEQYRAMLRRINQHDLVLKVRSTPDGFMVGVVHVPTGWSAAADHTRYEDARHEAVRRLVENQIGDFLQYLDRKPDWAGPSVCSYCEQVMSGAACTHARYEIGGVSYRRIPLPLGSDMPTCGDCNTPSGGLHHPGCDSERCPRCLGQSIGCDCDDDEQDSSDTGSNPGGEDR